jgi:hypothetical protein
VKRSSLPRLRIRQRTPQGWIPRQTSRRSRREAGSEAAASCTRHGHGDAGRRWPSPAWHITPDRRGGRAQPVTLPGSTLIGIFTDPLFVTSATLLTKGAGLFIYTDGLTEARTRDGDLLGQEGLAAFLAGMTSGPVSAAGLVAGTVALLGQLAVGVRDDVAVLALSVPPRS